MQSAVGAVAAFGAAAWESSVAVTLVVGAFACMVAATQLMTFAWWSRRVAPARTTRWATLLLGAFFGLLAGALSIGLLRASTPVALVVVVVATAVGFLRYRGGTEQAASGQVRRTALWGGDFKDADRIVGLCRRQLLDSRLTPRERLEVEFNLVSALLERSGSRGRDDSVPEAADLLDEMLQRPGLTPEDRFRVAANLVDLRNQLAARDGSDAGFQEAVDLQHTLATRIGDPSERGAALMNAWIGTATLAVFRLSHLDSAAPPPEVEALIDEATSAFRRAIDVKPAHLDVTPPLRTQLGMVLLVTDEEEGMGEIRAGWEEVRDRPMIERALAQLALLSAIVQTTDPGLPGAKAQVEEGRRLGRQLLEESTPLDAPVHRAMADLERLGRHVGEAGHR